MKTDKESKNIIVGMIVAMLIALTTFILLSSFCYMPKQNRKTWETEVILGYNHLLHRIWIDNPQYVEDVLWETDEFVVLDSLMNHHWGDTFEFYNKTDSLEYNVNYIGDWNIPKTTQEKLDSVFK